MARPDRAELVAALLAAQPRAYRERKPEQAQQRAEQLAAGALANWPHQVPPRVVNDPTQLQVLAMDDRGYDQPLATGSSFVLVGAGVRLRAIYRRGGPGDLGLLDVHVDPVGHDGIGRLAINELSYQSIQARMLLCGSTLRG